MADFDAAARERRDEMERPRCPAHNRTDCSPLLNGCGRLTAGFDREAARHDRDLIRGLKMTHTVSALLDQADALDALVESLSVWVPVGDEETDSPNAL